MTREECTCKGDDDDEDDSDDSDDNDDNDDSDDDSDDDDDGGDDDEAGLVFCLSMAAISPSQSDQKLNGERDEKIKVSDHHKDDGDGDDFCIHKRRLRLGTRMTMVIIEYILTVSLF